MSRILAAVAILEALVIAYLVSREPTGRAGRAIDAARDPGAAPTAPASPEDRPPPAPAGPAQATAFAVVYGSVKDAAGSPVSPGWVHFAPDAGDPRHATVQPDGHYALSGLAPGTYRASARVQGFESPDRTVELWPGPTRHDFVVERLQSIHVRFLTPEGTPLDAALAERIPGGPFVNSPLSAVATRDPPRDRLPMTELRAHRRFGSGEWVGRWDRSGGSPLPEGVAGVLLLRDPLPLHVSAVVKHVVLDTRLVTEPVPEIAFVIPLERVLSALATVRLRVVDARTGARVPAVVSLGDRNTMTFGGPPDAEGYVTFPYRAPGLLSLEVFAGGLETVTRYVPVPDGGEVDLGTLALGEAAHVRGRVVGPDGEAVAAWLIVRKLSDLSFPQPLDTSRSWRTDAEGGFEAKDVGRGELLVVARSKELALAATVVDTSGGPVDGVEIRLARGTPVAIVPEFEGDRHVLLTLKDSRGRILFAAFARDSSPQSLRLEEGSYLLLASDERTTLKEIPVRVGREHSTVRVRLEG